jgi:hypothetical protein
LERTLFILELARFTTGTEFQVERSFRGTPMYPKKSLSIL